VRLERVDWGVSGPFCSRLRKGCQKKLHAGKSLPRKRFQNHEEHKVKEHPIEPPRKNLVTASDPFLQTIEGKIKNVLLHLLKLPRGRSGPRAQTARFKTGSVDLPGTHEQKERNYPEKSLAKKGGKGQKSSNRRSQGKRAGDKCLDTKDEGSLK